MTTIMAIDLERGERVADMGTVDEVFKAGNPEIVCVLFSTGEGAEYGWYDELEIETAA